MTFLTNEAAQNFPRVTASYIEGKSRSIRHRQHQFHRLQGTLITYSSTIIEALQDDNNYLRKEALFEYSLALQELRSAYESISLEAELAAARAVEKKQDNVDVKVGVGMVYIRPDRKRSNIYAILSPLCAALAAGNCIIVEIPATTIRLTSILRKLLLESLDQDTFAVSDTLPPIEFLIQCLVVQQDGDSALLPSALFAAPIRILYSPRSPVNAYFVDQTADPKTASQSIIEAKFAFNGSSSFAPTIVFVHEAVRNRFTTSLLQNVGAFPGLSAAVPEQDGKTNTAEQQGKTKSLEIDILCSGPMGQIVVTRTWESYKNLTTSKDYAKIRTLVIHIATSLDHMIDATENIIENVFETPTTAFIFAAQPEATYLAQSVSASFTSVNTFPAELLVGPPFPMPMTAHQHSKSFSRYHRQMFENSRSIILSASPGSRILKGGFATGEAGPGSDFARWSEAMRAPLRPTGQKLGHTTGFFDAAIRVGGGLVLLPLLLLTGFLGRTAVNRIRSR